MGLTQQEYLERAYQRAFDDQGSDWIPENGFGANRPRIVKLYEYYKTLYNDRPDQFLWAGLGRMAGGAVVGGLDLLTSTPFSDPGPITNTMVEVGKAIFNDLAWLHEAFLDDTNTAIALATEHDLEHPARRSYAQAITQIASGLPDQIAEGNKALLEIEQYTIVQPFYDRLRNSPEAGFFGVFSHLRAVTGNVHPYHCDFIVSLPNGDVTLADDRWKWITLPGGMWEKWAEGFRGPTIGMNEAERTRLVNLPFDKIIQQDFGPTIPELLPPGTSCL